MERDCADFPEADFWPARWKSATLLASTKEHMQLLQLCILGLGLLQDRNVGISVLPEGKKIAVSGSRFSGVVLHHVCATELKIGKSTDR